MTLTASQMKGCPVIIVSFAYILVAGDFVLHNLVNCLFNFDQVSFTSKHEKTVVMVLHVRHQKWISSKIKLMKFESFTN